MPELPEIEHLRRTLHPRLINARITHVNLARADVVRSSAFASQPSAVAATVAPAALLQNCRIVELHRHGKQLAVIAQCGRALGIQLGMSGQLFYLPADQPPRQPGHIHCVWSILSDSGETGRLLYRDPRRFGCLRPFTTRDDLLTLQAATLGPDALAITAAALGQALGRTSQAVKAALLNQRLLAGVGNIYADEALFLARIHPLTPADRIAGAKLDALAAALRGVLQNAVEAGGSTLRDYRDANGQPGRYAASHKAYGRGGQPCITCGTPLERIVVTQRSTVFCPDCQPVR